MKVLAVTPNYPPGSRVGAWLATHQFLRYLAAEGHDVTVFAAGARFQPYTLDGVHVVSGNRGRTFGIDTAKDCDLVIAHAGDDGVGVDIAGAAGRRLVRMIHGAGHMKIGDPALAVFNSEALRAVTPHGCPSIVCHPPVHRSEWQVDRTGADAVTLVNCSQPKGIKTAWLCADRLPHTRFLGVKGGYAHQETPRAKNFETIPTTSDMRSVYAQTRVLLMPSAYETWGMVGVEAMCSGIPVIASPAAGLIESLGPAGIFVDRDDIDGWVREIRRLDDPAEYALASARSTARSFELDPTPDLERFAAALEALCG